MSGKLFRNIGCQGIERFLAGWSDFIRREISTVNLAAHTAILLV
jgi:hypothetical protein